MTWLANPVSPWKAHFQDHQQNLQSKLRRLSLIKKKPQPQRNIRTLTINVTEFPEHRSVVTPVNFTDVISPKRISSASSSSDFSDCDTLVEESPRRRRQSQALLSAREDNRRNGWMEHESTTDRLPSPFFNLEPKDPSSADAQRYIALPLPPLPPVTEHQKQQQQPRNQIITSRPPRTSSLSNAAPKSAPLRPMRPMRPIVAPVPLSLIIPTNSDLQSDPAQISTATAVRYTKARSMIVTTPTSRRGSSATSLQTPLSATYRQSRSVPNTPGDRFGRKGSYVPSEPRSVYVHRESIFSAALVNPVGRVDEERVLRFYTSEEE